MARVKMRVKTKVSAAQKLAGYVILGVLGLITAGLLVQQSRFNPAVLVALHPPQLQGRSQAVSGQAPAATAGFLPEVEGFSPLAPAENYNPDNLSDKIDGKAELYLAAGFKEMSSRSFNLGEAGGAHVDVYLYDMGSPAQAFAVFSGQRRPGSPGSPLTANAYSTANALFFTQGQFYVEIVADRTSETLQRSLEGYAAALIAKLPAAEGQSQDANKALFPQEGLTPDTVRLCTADTFGCEGLINIYTGEYSLKNGKATGFIARRDTREQAQADAKRYLEFLAANGYQKVETPKAPANLEVLALDNSFEIVFVQGQTLVGVHDATSKEAALELAATLQTALKGQP